MNYRRMGDSIVLLSYSIGSIEFLVLLRVEHRRKVAQKYCESIAFVQNPYGNLGFPLGSCRRLLCCVEDADRAEKILWSTSANLRVAEVLPLPID